MQDLEEKRLAHYTIQRRLARGGMSQVYLAFDEHTQHNVAIKVVHCSEDDYFVRFQREVKTLSALSHEHILPIIESGVHGSWHYCVMPYIERGTLRERMAKGPLTQEEAGSILEKAPGRRFKTVQAMAQAYARALQTPDQIKVVQLQDAHIMSGITLAVPTQRVIPVSAVTGSSRRRVHPAIAALIAVLFFMLPLSLGF